ncbi:sensor histidine kinase [Nocardioides vastitatis]|uniref:Sensor histidine kinase n=1 Tax=Nocardioides vastitatis TaxID=2568655 RepID=A0ABW0ZQN2_9ACTN
MGLATTALIVGTPYLVFGFYNPSLHLVLDSVDGCVALLAAYLLYGRYRRTRGLRELLLAEGLFLLAVAGLGLPLLLGLFQSLRPETLEVWLPLTVRFVGAVLIAVAALAGPARVRRPERQRWIALTPWALLALAAVVLWLQGDSLPVAVDATPPASAQRPVITGHPVLLAAQGFTALSFMVASVGFTAQAARRRDELLLWIGPACGLAAFARINYLLFPSIYTGWLYTGDLLRTGFYLVLLVGAAREISAYWSSQARAAVLEDRRRLARELHDGVVQEISFIRAEAHDVLARPEISERIISACDRALDEARAAIEALGRTPDEPLGYVLHRAAGEITDRFRGHLEVDLDDTVTADNDQRHALVRITREAVSNALRHGCADRVLIRLERDPTGRRLVVEDDGGGFDLEAVSTGNNGYGLTSMRERAQALPGKFSIASTPGHGTTVGVSW